MTINKNVLLKEYTTYNIGGPARYFCEIENESDLHEAIKFAKDKSLQIFVLGGGSNLIISDKGFDGLVIKLKAISYKNLRLGSENLVSRSARNKLKAATVEVAAGFDLPALIEKTTKAGLAGLEWAGGLPGTLGGAIFGNAGCFGHEIKEIIQNVYAVKITNNTLHVSCFTLQDCEFSYRNSKFKREGDWIILSCVLQFQKGDADELRKMAQEKIEYRKNRHPLEYPNIGSIFKNIDEQEKVQIILKRFPDLKENVRHKWFGKIPTAVLVEKAGLSGKQIGGAQISQKHANFIINKDNAKAHDVIMLIQEIKSTIKESFGIKLEEEVRHIGF